MYLHTHSLINTHTNHTKRLYIHTCIILYTTLYTNIYLLKQIHTHTLTHIHEQYYNHKHCYIHTNTLSLQYNLRQYYNHTYPQTHKHIHTHINIYSHWYIEHMKDMVNTCNFYAIVWNRMICSYWGTIIDIHLMFSYVYICRYTVYNWKSISVYSV